MSEITNETMNEGNPKFEPVTADEVYDKFLDFNGIPWVERVAKLCNSRIAAAVEQSVEELKQDLDCGCGVSGCRNMRMKCRRCIAEENDSLKQQLAARPPQGDQFH